MLGSAVGYGFVPFLKSLLVTALLRASVALQYFGL